MSEAMEHIEKAKVISIAVVCHQANKAWCEKNGQTDQKDWDAAWIYGEVKDGEAKTHPCIVPFEQLPEFQQKKDKLFQAIVTALR